MFAVGNIPNSDIEQFMIFGNALSFLLKPNTITENRKQ